MSAEEDSLQCHLRCLCPMHQIQDPLSFHPHQHDARPEAINQVSWTANGIKKRTRLESLAENLLIQLRDKRVEELEIRLKSMEDLIKRPVSDQSFGSFDADFGNGSRRPKIAPLAIQSEAEASDSSSNLNTASTTAGEGSQASDSSLPSPGGRCESITQSPNLTVSSSLLHCSRQQPKRVLAASSKLWLQRIQRSSYQNPSAKR